VNLISTAWATFSLFDDKTPAISMGKVTK